MRRAALFVLALVTVSSARAARVEADPNKDYKVTPAAGPWVVCAASFSGPDAPELSRQLVLVLRGRDNLPAYYHNYSDERRRQEKEYQELLAKSRPGSRARTVRIEEQCAVLVGGYADPEAAGRALAAVKKLAPPELTLASGKDPNQYLFTAGPSEGDPNRTEIQRAPVNPFAGAFVARNPTARQEARPEDGKKADPMLGKYNAGEKYSLLKCKKPWTLVVKEYQGAAVYQPRSATSSFLETLGFANKPGELLGAGAEEAHSVADVLRQLKFEAYVLHTRHGSLVTVGGFTGRDDPELPKMQQKLAALKIAPIQLFAQPMPMEVPRP